MRRASLATLKGSSLYVSCAGFSPIVSLTDMHGMNYLVYLILPTLADFGELFLPRISCGEELHGTNIFTICAHSAGSITLTLLQTASSPVLLSHLPGVTDLPAKTQTYCQRFFPPTGPTFLLTPRTLPNGVIMQQQSASGWSRCI